MFRAGIEISYDSKYPTSSRLPVEPRPEIYDLKLEPSFTDFSFTGTVDITFKKTDAKISEIILHGKDLEIKDGFVTLMNDTKVGIKKIIYNSKSETIVLTFVILGDFIPKRLKLDFSGSLNENMTGFYKSSFKIGDQTVFAAVTQFEATFARQAFPCFDEPAFKAKFDVTLVYDATPIKAGDKSYDIVSLSNGELLEIKTLPGRGVEAKFDRTPIMSTYLLAFVIGPFEYVKGSDNPDCNCNVKIYTTPGKKDQGQFAADFTTKALVFYEKYFGIPYPLSKLDLIAVPDFAFGAMENWGLITYREVCLLFDPKTTSTASKQYIAIVIAHELAHQWFGNLVTMNWWSDLWLNEGFASFMQYLCTDTIYPEWDLWSQFVFDMWSLAMVKDSLHSSHPVEVPVNEASEIDQIFDEISYKKGCSIIRMMYNYIGDQMFRVGMTSYLNKFAYKNAITNDLWNSLGEASKKPISEMMSGWTLKLGYPWIKVELIESIGEDATISLQQQIFTANGNTADGDEDRKWMIPITIVSGSPNVDSKTEFISEQKTLLTLAKQGDHWLKLNKGTIGFFRTAYSPNLLNKLIEIIKNDLKSKESNPSFKELLGPMDRLGIQNDYFALCQAGHVQTGQMLNLLACYEDETNYTVWRSIDGCISALSTLYRNTEYSKSFKAFVRKLYGKICSKLTWQPKDGEIHTNSMLRSLILNRMMLAGDENVIEIAKTSFSAQLKESKLILADIRDVVYTAISIYGDELDFNELFKMHSESDSHEEKDRIARSLAKTQDPDRLKRVIKLILSDAVKVQDKGNTIITLGAMSPDACWKLFIEQHGYFSKIYKTNIVMGRIIKASTEYFTTIERVNEVELFFKENNSFPGLEMPIQQSLETMRLTYDWASRLANDQGAKDFISQY